MTAPGTHSVVSETLAADSIGSVSVAQFLLTTAAPMLVIVGVVGTGWAVTGVLAVPVGFAAVAGLLALFAIGYTAMARRIVNAGALYTYSAIGLGRPAGIAAGLLALLSYNTMQVGAYGMIGAVASSELQQYLGVSVPWYLCALLAWALVAILGSRKVEFTGKVLATLLAGEVLFVIAAGIAGLLHPAGGHVSFAALNPGNLFASDTGVVLSGVGAVLAIAWTAYIGFEQAPNYSEESKNPRRTVLYATFGSLGLMAAVYLFVPWAMSVSVGPDKIVAAAQEQSTELLFGVAAPLGDAAVLAGHLLLLTSVFAGLLALHNTCARYAYALGREGVLPRVMARTSLKTRAPIAGSIAQTITGLAAIALYAAMGWDPMVNMMFWLAAIGGVGILLLVTITSLAIVAYLIRNPAAGLFTNVIAPVLSSIGLIAVCGLCLDNYTTLLGVDPDSPLGWIFPACYGIVIVAGLLWGFILRASRHPAYDQIGNGATVAPATVATAQPAMGGIR